jgi:hypothetical protein
MSVARAALSRLSLYFLIPRYSDRIARSTRGSGANMASRLNKAYRNEISGDRNPHLKAELKKRRKKNPGIITSMNTEIVAAFSIFFQSIFLPHQICYAGIY